MEGRRNKGGLGLSAKEVMGSWSTSFSAQIFRWGVVTAILTRATSLCAASPTQG